MKPSIPKQVRILVAHDFGPAAEKALEWAAALAAGSGGLPLHVVHIANSLPLAAPELVVIPTMSDADLAALRESLETIVRKVDAEATAELIVGPSPGPAIVDAARRVGADLIAIGTHGRIGFSRLLLGSVAEYVSRHATCPVLTVRASPPEVESPPR